MILTMRSSNRRPEPPKPSGPPVEVVIETIGGEGDGVAAGPIYVPFTLPGETVRATGGGERRDLEAVLLDTRETRPVITSPLRCACVGMQPSSSVMRSGSRSSPMMRNVATERCSCAIRSDA